MNTLKRFSEFINEEFGYVDREKEYHGDVEHYRYLDIEKLPNGLMVHLNEDGKKESEESDNLNENNFDEYFEDVQGNSEYLYHNDMGDAGFGLTNAPGITDGYHIGDGGDLTDDDHEDSEVYWFPNYMVEDFTETLKKDGKVFFTKAD